VRKKLTYKGFIDWTSTKAWAEEVVAQYDVRTPGTWVAARALSGGNLQKFLMGRELSQAPEVVIINQPTWGVDAAAAAFIRQEILNRAQDGAALVVISQDLDDLLEVSDRFAALNEGRLTPARPTEGLTVDEIGLMMGGAHGMEVAHHG
jgi:simple sugar transport system ATP-binding protein